MATCARSHLVCRRRGGRPSRRTSTTRPERPQERRSAAELEESEMLNRSIVEASIDCIKVLSSGGDLLYMNEAGRNALELADQTRLYGRSWADLWPRHVQKKVMEAVQQAASGGIGRFSAECRTAKGNLKWWDVVISPASSGCPGKLVCISRDITSHKFAEDQIRWVANHDALTKLPNRSLFQELLDKEIADVQGAGGGFALLLLDLDDFKRVNDTLGHDTGDALLRTFAARLREATRWDDCVARLGGDEFAIILRGVRNPEQLKTAVQAIFEKLKEPCVHEGRMLDCHTSIGASLFPAQAPSKTELMKNADVALYAAKDAGRGTFRLFEPAFRAEMQRHNSMLSIAKDAIAQGLILPFYQPKIDLATGGLHGFEALLRWQHPQKGVQVPATIEAAFKDFSLAAAISDRMIAQVIQDMRGWLDRGLQFGHVAVNAAAAEFRRGDFAERLLEQMGQADIPAKYIQIEVTETVFLGRGAEYVERALKTLSSAGVQIALDDFGTGYASLSHLKQFPVNIIKIDRSFIRDLHEDPEDEAIVRAVISLGRSLDIAIVAEGIETLAQSAFLRKFDCGYGQGFLFGAAAPAGEVPTLIEKFGGRGAAAEMLGKGTPSASTPFGAGARGGHNIYIVDDDRDLRESTAFLLRMMGFACRCFSSGAEFLNNLADLEPGCILLDMRMDGLTGPQVLAELNWAGLNWPIIVTTGELGTEVAERAMGQGAFGFLAKPFEQSQMLELFEEAFLKLASGVQIESARAA
jgi:diguanylate cyclase (GGDEF)-like protein/PAS domain S-box-containing protein